MALLRGVPDPGRPGRADSVRVPLRDETHDLAAMAAAITPRTRLIFVCNPNNPTGTVVRAAELEAFLDQVPADCLVVLDEAYREYVRDETAPDGMDLYRDRPNVAVLRTFSKAYGLAGLRTGFMVAHEPVAEAVRTTMLPFSVNSIAQAAAVASLAAEDELLERVELTVKERTRVREALIADGWAVPPDRGQLRLAAPRASTPWTSPRPASTRASRSARSPARAPGSASATPRPTTPSWRSPTPSRTATRPVQPVPSPGSPVTGKPDLIVSVSLWPPRVPAGPSLAGPHSELEALGLQLRLVADQDLLGTRLRQQAEPYERVRHRLATERDTRQWHT